MTHPQDTPANPAQVTDAIRGIVEDALNSTIPEPWEVAEHATRRILAAIGAGDEQPFHLVEEFDDVGAQMVVAPAIGAGGQAVDSCLSPAPVQEAVAVGVASKFGDMTRAVFNPSVVPVGSKLYLHPVPQAPGMSEALLKEARDELDNWISLLAVNEDYDEDVHDARELMERIDAAIAQAPAGGEWRPIETAPRDGTEIVLLPAKEERS